METGICLFLMGFHALGLGFMSKKIIENGNGLRSEQDSN
jgi:hypothetical protein